VREDNVGLPVANHVRNLLARLEISHEFAVVDIEDVSGNAKLGMAGFDLRLAPLRERTAGHREVPDVTVGHGNQLDFVSLRREERGGPRELQLGVVWMRAEGNNAQLPWCRRLR
jgi:hypothetical protein